MANIYSAPSLSTMKVSTFKGSDCSVPEDQQKAYRAAKSENMMPYAVGEVGKRPGVQQIGDNDESNAADLINTHAFPNVKAVYKKAVVYWFDDGEDSPLTGYHIAVLLENGADQTWLEPVNRVEKMPTIIECGNTTYIFIYSETWTSVTCTYSGNGIKAKAVVLKVCGNTAEIYTDPYSGYDSIGPTYTKCVFDGTNIARSGGIFMPNDPPIVAQGCNPSNASGFPYKAANMLNPYVMETFCIKEGAASIFHLNTKGLPAEVLRDVFGLESDPGLDYYRYNGSKIQNFFKVQVFCVSSDGELKWMDRPFVEEDGYNPSNNTLYLSPAGNVSAGITSLWSEDGGNKNKLGTTPIDGEDNVKITLMHADAYDFFVKICSATMLCEYGVGGHKDRLIVAGGLLGTEIYYSEMNDFLHIPQINFIDPGAGNEILALDGTTDVLTVLTDKGVYLGSASAIDTTDSAGYVRDAVITISNRIPAPKPKNGGRTAILGGEVVYLSTEGVIAVASKENYAARYAEHRSAMIDREMLKDDPRELISLGRFLMIRCANGVWWLLDENQPNSEGDKPYASHQYEGWRLTGMPCDSAFAENGRLYIVKDGIVYRWTDGTQASHFHDEYDGNKTAISAWWEIPWIFGSTIYKNKIFQRLGILLGQIAGADTSVKIEGKKNDEEWSTLWDYDGSLCTFGYDKMDYSLFTYSGKAGNPNQSRKIKIKKAKQFKLRFINDYMDQPLILREYGLDYVQES